MTKLAIVLLSIALINVTSVYTSLPIMAFQEMAQLGQDKASELPHKEIQLQLTEFKTTYPVIYKILMDGSQDPECDKIRIDGFTDCKFTFEGVEELDLNEKEAFDMTEAIFSKCIAASKELCPL